MLNSAKSFAFKYGYVESRVRLPKGQGLWSALWMLPTTRESKPEVDIFETVGEQPDTVRGSDVSFVSKSRLEGLDLSRFLPGAPDLAVEVLSSSDWREEIHAKIADYLAAGARLCWVVDCDRRRVSVYRKLLFPTHLSADDVLDGEDVIPEFSIQVEALFED